VIVIRDLQRITHSALIKVEFPGVESCLGHAKHQRCVRIDLAGRPSLRIKPGDLILNRQNDAMLLQIIKAPSTHAGEEMVT